MRPHRWGSGSFKAALLRKFFSRSWVRALVAQGAIGDLGLVPLRLYSLFKSLSLVCPGSSDSCARCCGTVPASFSMYVHVAGGCPRHLQLGHKCPLPSVNTQLQAMYAYACLQAAGGG